jgi:F-type H+-transporting ATPase subunit epsilon
VLVDEVFAIDDLDASELQDRLRRAEDELSKADEDSEEARVAARAKRRYEAFLTIARG